MSITGSGTFSGAGVITFSSYTPPPSGSHFVIVSGSTDQATTSPDGVTWTLQTLPTTTSQNWYSVAYGANTFVTVAYNTNIAAASTDGGATWTPHTLPTTDEWQTVTYGGGKFVAIVQGQFGTPSTTAATSPDGITWTQQTLATTTYNEFWQQIAYGNGLFVVISVGSSNPGPGFEYFSDAILTSPDGITWTARTLPVSNYWISITYGAGVFVIVSGGGSGTSDVVLASSDGTTWTQHTLPATLSWRSVAFGNSTFVAVATPINPGDTALAATSSDGSTWTIRNMPLLADYVGWYSVGYGANIFVAATAYANNAATSSDGITWTAQTLPSDPNWSAIASR